MTLKAAIKKEQNVNSGKNLSLFFARNSHAVIE